MFAVYKEKAIELRTLPKCLRKCSVERLFDTYPLILILLYQTFSALSTNFHNKKAVLNRFVNRRRNHKKIINVYYVVVVFVFYFLFEYRKIVLIAWSHIIIESHMGYIMKLNGVGKGRRWTRDRWQSAGLLKSSQINIMSYFKWKFKTIFALVSSILQGNLFISVKTGETTNYRIP